MLTRSYVVKSEAAARRQVAYWARAGIGASYVRDVGMWTVFLTAAN